MNYSNAKEMDRSSLEERHRDEIEGDRLKNRSMITIFVFIPPDIYIFFIFTKVFRVEYFVLRYCSDFFFSFSLFPFLSGEKAIRKLEGGW